MDPASETSVSHLKEGDPAPEFSVPDQNSQVQNLKFYRGKSVLLYFYPEDDTSG